MVGGEMKAEIKKFIDVFFLPFIFTFIVVVIYGRIDFRVLVACTMITISVRVALDVLHILS
jgi:hypothetical protein